MPRSKTKPRAGGDQRDRPTKRTTASNKSAGRYTPPVPRETRRSPAWYPYVLLSALIVGVICIVLNYMAVVPHSPSNWYTLGGLVSIVVGAVLATSYR